MGCIALASSLAANCRPEVFKGKMYLLKSVGYQAIARADLFTLPCDQQVQIFAACHAPQSSAVADQQQLWRSHLACCCECGCLVPPMDGIASGLNGCYGHLQDSRAGLLPAVVQCSCSCQHGCELQLCETAKHWVHLLQELERYIAPLQISDTQPWLLQHFIRGPEYASYSIVHGGSVVAHADNVAELSCLNYAHVGSPEVGPPLVTGHGSKHCMTAVWCSRCGLTHLSLHSLAPSRQHASSTQQHAMHRQAPSGHLT